MKPMNLAKPIKLAALSIWAAITLITPLASAQFNIDAAVNHFVGTRPSGVATGDFDGDGDIDLATTVDNPDRIILLLNDGAGHYTLGPVTLLPRSSSPQDLVAGDLNGDDVVDLAVAIRDPQGSVLIMMNNGGGTFVLTGSVAVGARPRGLAIADIDGDDDLDLAVANRDSNTASVLTNDGAGGFSAATFAAGNEPRATAFVDFNGDGDLDLAVTIHDDRTVATFVNNGGVFVPSAILPVGPFVRPDGITAADLDGDGDDDLAVATDDQTFNINQATIFMNTGAGFTGPLSYPTGGRRTGKIIAADFDCDGLIDLASTNRDSNDVSFLRNLGGGVFGAPMFPLPGAGMRPGAITAADLDGDGDPDIAVANRDSNDVSVLINATCSQRGDLNCDGEVNAFDIEPFLVALFDPDDYAIQYPDCNINNADTNGDGSIDAFDIESFLELLFGP